MLAKEASLTCTGGFAMAVPTAFDVVYSNAGSTQGVKTAVPNDLRCPW
jgi:hypothetical protein